LERQSKSSAVEWISQRAQFQQDIRAVQNMLVKDISMAGAGLPKSGLALISGTGTAPRYGCDATNGCTDINDGSINFPSETIGANTIRYLYAIIPGYAKGKIINSSQGATDVITVTYSDTSFPWDQYDVTFPGGSTTAATFTVKSPTPVPPPPPINDPAVGLKIGDLVWFSGSTGGSTVYAVGEVTSMSGAASPYTVNFATTDPMALNQTGGNSGLSGLVTPVAATGITATRIFLITYSIDIPPDPSK
jgi:hypothetical protein